MILNMLEQILKSGGIAVIPTDTLYGLVGQALNPLVQKKLKELKQRPPEKPFITLIADLADLKLFNIILNKNEEDFLNTVWPGPVSVIIQDQAFRLPDLESLRELIKVTGPLSAPSANPHSLPSATTIREAKNYFGDQVDYYAEGGTLAGPPSKLLLLNADGTTQQLR